MCDWRGWWWVKYRRWDMEMDVGVYGGEGSRVGCGLGAVDQEAWQAGCGACSLRVCMRHRLKIFRWLQRLSLESEDGAAEASWSVWEGPKPEGGQRGWCC